MNKKIMILVLLLLSGCIQKENKQEQPQILQQDSIHIFYDSPDSYQGYQYHFLGNIIEDVEYNEQGYTIFTMKDSNEYATKNMIVYYQGKVEDIKKNDLIELDGIIEGTIKVNDEILIKYNASSIKLIESPKTHYDINQSKTISNITFMINSIDFENDKTKVSVTIENHSGARYNFYDYLTYIKGTTKYDAIYNYDEGDIILDSMIENNTPKSGLIIFREINRENITMHIGGWSGNPSLGEINSDFEIEI